MAVVKDNGGNPTNFVEFEIVVNEYAKDLIEGEDTYILHDYMSSNLEPRNTLTVEAQINGETRELSLLECQFAYDSAEHKMTFVLPDEAKITIKYECLVNGVGGTTEQINNRVSLQGKSFIQDIVDSAFQIQDHQGSATSGNEQFFLKKTDSRTGKGLEGVTFKLYGDTRPSENEGAADLHLTHEDHVHDMFLYGTFTTGPNGTVHIHDTQLTSGHLYALEEVAPLEGYIGASDLYWFYMIEPKPNSLRELDIIYSFDTVTIENDPVGGFELPSTGGAGTTMFYIFGGILVLAAVVLLVTKKRMAVAE